jgi:hypothetical protein
MKAGMNKCLSSNNMTFENKDKFNFVQLLTVRKLYKSFANMIIKTLLEF